MTESAAKTKLSTKGQVILPKSVRDHLRWPPGTELSVEETADGVFLRRAAKRPASSLDAVFGSLHVEGRRLSLEGMDEAIRIEAQRRARD
jgi:AbrB family looped-hinge helix DNA binding protein